MHRFLIIEIFFSLLTVQKSTEFSTNLVRNTLINQNKSSTEQKPKTKVQTREENRNDYLMKV